MTWNDYEEGTEIETGIDNCVSVSGSVSGTDLSWNIGGQENTIDHYSVFISQDGQNLSCFTTGAGTQTGTPVVVAVSPQNGAAGVPVNAVVQVQLSAAVSAVSVTNSAIQVSAGGMAVTTALWLEVATADPIMFVAVTWTRMVEPMSLGVSV